MSLIAKGGSGGLIFAIGSYSGLDWQCNIFCGFHLNLGLSSDIQAQIDSQKLTHQYNKKQPNPDFIKRILKSQQMVFQGSWRVTRVWTFATPLFDCIGILGPAYHQYVIIRIQNSKGERRFASLEKDMQRIWIMISKDFQTCRDQILKSTKSHSFLEKRCKKQGSQPKKLEKWIVDVPYLKLIFWIYTQNQHTDKYNLIISNCQIFSKEVVQFLKVQKIKAK